MKTKTRVWGVVPAAGVGARMAAQLPKQYLSLDGTAILQHTLHALLALPALEQVMVALATGDEHWPTLAAAQDARVDTTTGGAQRADSVLACLLALEGRAGAEDWVLVHDAARPCISLPELELLLATLGDDPVGGLLALPVADTVKRADAEQRAVATLDREGLWLAQTPQMFRYAMLRSALQAAQEQGLAITDEASAMEHAGHAPRLVPGAATNIKITRPADLALAGHYLAIVRGQSAE